jgi:2-polyprenyl-3-methyl-5-hydroxy-6-metoxy-1,4-benzoquinol methylase
MSATICPVLSAMALVTSARFGQETDNAEKYERHGGVEARLLARFRARLLAQVVPLAPARVLDAGCGEGHVSAWLAGSLTACNITGVDGRADALATFRARNPGLTVLEGDLRALPFPDGAFDLVVCTEVLEHLPAPRAVLRELARVSSGHLFLTVPHEPFFRGGNLVRGRYVGRLGSTPGHLSTWGRRGFLSAVASEAEPVRWVSLFPWQGVLARPRGPGTGP